jgi:pyridoxal phosphate enzyme (YggS family)
MSIGNNIQTLKCSLPDHVRLIAVSKTKPVSGIMEAYQAGQRLFGENKAQEMEAKFPLLPKDIEWHFIGHLQTNKVKYIAPFVSCIHAVDSLRLLLEINREALRNNRIIPCLLQFHIAEEETKFGLSVLEAETMLLNDTLKTLRNIEIAGVMGMATYTENMDQIRKEFRNLRNIFEMVKEAFFKDQPSFSEVSMGMSDDYQIAIEEGSTMVRIGSAVFGMRDHI